MALQLKTKFYWLGGILLVGSLVSAYLNYVESDLSDDQEIAVEVIQRHMNADMMHDGIRGNIYSALVGAQSGNLEMVRNSQQEIANMSEEFTKAVNENLAADLPDEIKQQFGKIKKSEESYTTYSKRIAAEAKDPARAMTMLPEFDKVFDVLEEDQKQASDMLMSWSKSLDSTDHIYSLLDKVILVIMLLCAVGLPIFAAQAIFKPLQSMMQAMRQLADGNTATEVPYTDRVDEIGDMAKSVQVFKENAIKVSQLAEEQKKQEEKARVDKQKAMQDLASSFEANVKNVVDMVASAATQMDATSRSVANIAENSQSKLSALSGQIDSATRNVQTVASATSQLSAAVNEINKQVTRATSITSTAVEEAKKADTTVQSLTEAAQKIGEVVEMINSIAAQINLLALNATIEAARAGEAGKGFAVVASEVKNLATQTTKATEQIGQYISSIQGATGETVNVIKVIGRTIDEINQISTTIAAAVEEQSVSTQDIANNVQQAAQSTEEVSRNASDVTTTSKETGESANQMMAATTELSRQSEVLRREVDKFLSGVRSA